MSAPHKRERPDVIYWVGADDGTPIAMGQHVYVYPGIAKGVRTRWSKAADWYRARGGTQHVETAHVYVGTVTWERLDDVEARS